MKGYLVATLLFLTMGQSIFDNRPPVPVIDVPNDYNKQEVKDLENLAVQFYQAMCRQNGRKDNCFKWVDIHETHPEERHLERQLLVDEMNNLQYHLLETIEKPSLILSQDYCNSLEKDAYFQFKKSTETGSVCTW